uniref:Uncharacterized protein n=1 Tax=Rhizophora mucronata TaxID=61149 RepID=A0A2P2NDP2_RHIMU
MLLEFTLEEPRGKTANSVL